VLAGDAATVDELEPLELKGKADRVGGSVYGRLVRYQSARMGACLWGGAASSGFCVMPRARWWRRAVVSLTRFVDEPGVGLAAELIAQLELRLVVGLR
jgi:hypothetical protein